MSQITPLLTPSVAGFLQAINSNLHSLGDKNNVFESMATLDDMRAI
jgi:hypothetical protein